MDTVVWDWSASLGGSVSDSFWVQVDTDAFVNVGEGNLYEVDPGTYDVTITAVAQPTWVESGAAVFAVPSTLQDGRVFLSCSNGTVETHIGTYNSGDKSMSWVQSTDMPFDLGSPCAQTVISDGRILLFNDNSGPEIWLGEVSGDTITWSAATYSGDGITPVLEVRAVALSYGRVLFISGSGTWIASVEESGLSVSVSSFYTDPADWGKDSPSMAVLWPVSSGDDTVFIASGYDSGWSNESSRLDVSLFYATRTDGDPLPTSDPRGVRLFRMSNDDVIALYYDAYDDNGVIAKGPLGEATGGGGGSDWSVQSIAFSEPPAFWCKIAADTFIRAGEAYTLLLEYDPGLGTFSTTEITPPPWGSNALEKASWSIATQLWDGRIFLSTGYEEYTNTYIGTYEAGDITWVESTALPFIQYGHHAQTLLLDHRIVVLDTSTAAACLTYLGTVDGDDITWVEAYPLGVQPSAVAGTSATTLRDGRILVSLAHDSLFFGTVVGDEITWEEATVTGTGPHFPEGTIQSLWPGAALIAGGYNDAGAGDYLSDVTYASFSGTDVTLTALEALPHGSPEVTIGLFRLSDAKVVALYDGVGATGSYAAIWVDPNPPLDALGFPLFLNLSSEVSPPKVGMAELTLSNGWEPVLVLGELSIAQGCSVLSSVPYKTNISANCGVLSLVEANGAIQTSSLCMDGWVRNQLGLYSTTEVPADYTVPANLACTFGVLHETKVLLNEYAISNQLHTNDYPLISYSDCGVLSPPFDLSTSFYWWVKGEDHVLFNSSYTTDATAAGMPLVLGCMSAYEQNSMLNLGSTADYEVGTSALTLYSVAERPLLSGVTLASPYGVCGSFYSVYSLRDRVISL